MRIGIVGAGVIGQATGNGLRRLGHDIFYFDINEEKVNRLREEGLRIKQVPYDTDNGPMDVVFIATPEGAVTEALEFITSWNEVPEVIAVRSTVPPGVCGQLEEMSKRPISHVPEFLREAVAEYEFLNPEAILIGSRDYTSIEVLTELFRPFGRRIYITTPEITELVKLSINGYLATVISYWNQFKLMTSNLGVNSHQVGMMATAVDHRIGAFGSRMHGSPYGGKCLPKDINQLINTCREEKVESPLFEAVKAVNRMYGGD